jgi:ABC-2 type transport system permease protein
VRAVAARELRAQSRAVLAWGAALGALGAFMAAIYPSVRDPIEQVVGSYPGGLKEAFGIGAMTTVEGYVHAELFSLMVPLAVGVFAIHSATRPTVGAEERGELDTVLALPLPRAALVAGSMLATAVAAAAILTVTAALIWAAGRAAGTGISLGLTAAGALGLWPFAVFFAGVASLAAGGLPRAGVVTGVASSVLVAMYALDLAGRLVSALEPLRRLSAFRYYGAPLRDGLDIPSSAALVVAGALLAAAGAALLQRRDMRAR